jgi:hypothetical protein
MIPCEVYYYSAVKSDCRICSFRPFIIQPSMLSSKEVPLRTFSETLLIVLSYFGLCFGFSLLALIQIPFSVFEFRTRKIIKIDQQQDSTKSEKLTLLFELLSQLKSIHCSKYSLINMKENYASFKKYFWLIIIFIVFSMGVWWSIEQIGDYSSSKVNFIITDLDDENMTIQTPKIDLCFIIFYTDLLFNNINETYSDIHKYLEDKISNIHKNIYNSSNMFNQIEALYNEMGFIYNNKYQNLKNLKLSTDIENTKNLLSF